MLLFPIGSLFLLRNYKAERFENYDPCGAQSTWNAAHLNKGKGGVRSLYVNK